MQTALIAAFLAVVVGFFVPPLRAWLQARLARQPSRIFLVPAALFLLVACALVSVHTWSWRFLAFAAAYVILPTALVYIQGPRTQRYRWRDLAAILLLWLPVEFTAGKNLLPPRAWNIMIVAGHGAAVTLGLFLFLAFRRFKGMKYNLPGKPADAINPVVAFLIVAPVLAVLGLALGFLGPFRMPHPFHAVAFAALWLKILLAVAIPEELLFRSLIQNWIMQNFGASDRTLLAAAFVFGAAHLNNGPASVLPNWRYMILATIAGFVYGKVFWKSSTILSSAALHAFVNAVRHTFFL